MAVHRHSAGHREGQRGTMGIGSVPVQSTSLKVVGRSPREATTTGTESSLTGELGKQLGHHFVLLLNRTS